MAGAADSDFDSDEMACFGKEASDSDDRLTSNEEHLFLLVHRVKIVDCQLSIDTRLTWDVVSQVAMDLKFVGGLIGWKYSNVLLQ